jgi:hypothetical protein
MDTTQRHIESLKEDTGYEVLEGPHRHPTRVCTANAVWVRAPNISGQWGWFIQVA